MNSTVAHFPGTVAANNGTFSNSVIIPAPGIFRLSQGASASTILTGDSFGTGAWGQLDASQIGASVFNTGQFTNDGSQISLLSTATVTNSTIITTNLTVVNSLTVSNITVTNVTVMNNLTVSNSYVQNGHHNTLTVTNALTPSQVGASKIVATAADGALTNAVIGGGLAFTSNTLFPTNVTEAQLLLAANTTANVSTTKHGFAPVLPNDATQYLDGTGAYSTPSAAGTLTVTNAVTMPWTTLTLTGTNVSALNLAAGSLFKLTLTNNAYFGVPSGLPGTNSGQTIQIHLLQDGTGTRTVTMTNTAWILAGSGASTNAVPTINTNANGVTILTFVTSPFSSTLLYGVPTAYAP